MWYINDLDKPPVMFPRNKGVETMTIRPDCQWLVTSHFDTTIRLWDLGSDQPIKERHVLDGNKEVAQKLIISPNGHRLMATAGAKDPYIRIWDLTAEDPAKSTLMLKKGFHGYVYGSGFTPDSQRLIFVGQDRLIRVWDLSAADPVETQAVLRGHNARIRGFAISADGQRLFTGDEDGLVNIWDLRGLGAQPITLKRHEKGLRRLIISPDGNRLVTTDGTGRLLLWVLPANELISLAAQTVGRNLCSQEFDQYFPGHDYRETFPKLPIPDNDYYSRVSGNPTAYNAVRVTD
jgi:WD40 repeat protein